MPEPQERGIEERLSRVEHDVVILREEVALARNDAIAARALASGADRDVSEVRAELRAHTSALNALRETQLEHHAEMREFQAETRAGFATVQAGMRHIVSLLESRSTSDDADG